MKPSVFAWTLTAAVAAACYDTSSPVPPRLVVNPILDSTWVGDSLPSRTVILLDANLQPQNPGPVTWTVDPVSGVATIDAATGKIHGVGKGAARIWAHAAGDSAPALVIVSRPLDMTLLMDTVYLMPGDTFTIPVAIQKKDPLVPDTVWFDPSPSPAIYAIDTATGLVTAQGVTGGPIPYVAHVSNGTTPVTDAGVVVVMSLTDTTGGKFSLTIIGTAIRHEVGVARAMNYTNQNGDLAFRLTDSLINASVYEKVYITLPTAVLGTGPFEIDSLNPQETATSIATLSAFCNPPRPWALWSSILPLPGVRAFSNTVDKQAVAGELGITQRQPVTGGYAISGRFKFTAQRTDLYYDPLGILTVRGTFVAPLVDNTTMCRR